ncbi:hypothetical protein ACFY36_50510 [Actinoplanes sp. NPDC000266]
MKTVRNRTVRSPAIALFDQETPQMHVQTQQLLQPDTGTQLTNAVRLALIEMGEACNQAGLIVNQAIVFHAQVQAYAEPKRARPTDIGLTTQLINDLELLAEQHHDQALVVMARAATVYAVYASQVATAVALQQVPPLPQAEVILPSDLILAFDHYLPPVPFSDPSAQSAEQIDTLAAARQDLARLISEQMQGEPITYYDDVAAVTAELGSTDRLTDFPDALHAYAAALVWYLSIASNDAECDDGSPAPH